VDTDDNSNIPRIFNNTFGNDGFVNNNTNELFERNEKSMWKNGGTSLNSTQKSAASQFG
jgi:6-phosphofructokinase